MVDCRRSGRLGAAQVLAEVRGPARDAAWATRVDADRLRIEWSPPAPGRYAVSATFLWLYQTNATPALGAYPEEGDPIYLGALEGRCEGRCGPGAHPRRNEACGEAAAVPGAPAEFVVTGCAEIKV